MEILLESKRLKIKNILKKTKAQMFKNLKINDEILITVPVKAVGGGSHGTYAVALTITNLNTNEKAYKTFNEIRNILICFELEVVE